MLRRVGGRVGRRANLRRQVAISCAEVVVVELARRDGAAAAGVGDEPWAGRPDGLVGAEGAEQGLRLVERGGGVGGGGRAAALEGVAARHTARLLARQSLRLVGRRRRV
eukprot:scaffold2637_cov27-Phaeocystis_antarctica.AAC.1